MRCISKIEELTNTNKSQLFIDISSESPIGDKHVSIFSSDRPGSTPENPMAFVVEPILTVSSPASNVVPTPHPTFKKRIRVIKGHGASRRKSSGVIKLTCLPVSDYRNPGWLATTPGEILRTTTAPAQPQPWVRPSGSKFNSSVSNHINTYVSDSKVCFKVRASTLPTKRSTEQGKWAVSTFSISYPLTRSDLLVLHHYHQSFITVRSFRPSVFYCP